MRDGQDLDDDDRRTIGTLFDFLTGDSISTIMARQKISAAKAEELLRQALIRYGFSAAEIARRPRARST